MEGTSLSSGHTSPQDEKTVAICRGGESAYTVFLAGGIASGKSRVAQLLRRKGAWVCDLDQLARDVVAPGSEVADSIAAEFGDDLFATPTGELNRSELAARVFASPADTARLEALELPAIKARLIEILTVTCCAASVPPAVVVEVPLLDRMEDMLGLVDDVLVVSAPVELRRQRACGRGMSEADFDQRLQHQPDDAYLRVHATSIIDNSGDEDTLERAVDAWWDRRVRLQHTSMSA